MRCCYNRRACFGLRIDTEVGNAFRAFHCVAESLGLLRRTPSRSQTIDRECEHLSFAHVSHPGRALRPCDLSIST